MPLEAGARLWDLPVFPLDNIQIDLDYRTEIIRSRAGREQRLARRDRPRKRVGLFHNVADDCFRAALEQIQAYQEEPWAVPDRTRRIATTGVLNLGAGSVTVAALPPWAVAGEAVSMQQPGRMDVFTVLTALGTTITLAEPAPVEYPAGSWIMPAEPGRIEATVVATKRRGRTMDLRANFDIMPGLALDVLPPAAPSVFNGRELWTTPPHRLEPVAVDYLAEIEYVDFGFGRKEDFTPEPFNAERLRVNYGPCGLAEIQLVEDLFRRAKGRRGEFYAPTWSQDLVPVALAPGGSATITVAGDLIPAYGTSTVQTAFAVQRQDRTWEPQLVSSMVAAGADTLINIGGTWSADVDPSTVRRVSWLPVWRFASDNLKATWRAGFASVQVAWETLEDLP